MFKPINHVSDVQNAVADKKEIRFIKHPGGVIVACYQFVDSSTFDSPEALECRGIAFDATGSVISRPLHKFFSVGEKEWLTLEKLAAREDIAAIYDKIDGSMIATAWLNGALHWRSRQSFDSEVARLASSFVERMENTHIRNFAAEIASQGMTAIFEFVHPETRIVVAHDTPSLRLLHIRDNVTGNYVMLDQAHAVHDLITHHRIPLVHRFDGMSLAQAHENLCDMKDTEGYVIQFSDGEMVKLKCPWYLRIHDIVTGFSERDIAQMVIDNKLDDVKGYLTEAGFDIASVNSIETRLKTILVGLMDEVEAIYAEGQHLDRKSFAQKYCRHPLFGLAIKRYQNTEVPLLEWYSRTSLRNDFGTNKLKHTTSGE